MLTRLGENRLLSGRWLLWLCVALAAHAWLATPILMARGMGLASITQQTLAGLAGLAALGAFIFACMRWQLDDCIFSKLEKLSPPSPTIILIIGVILRLGWALAFPAKPTSDGEVYLELAQRVLNEHVYLIAEHRAYWPPGYPFYLLPWLIVLPAKLAVPIAQSALFVAGALGVRKLGLHLGNEKVSRCAMLLFAIWPTLFAMCATPEKEALVIALLPWITLGLLSERTHSQFLAGLGLGWAILAQPAFLPMAALAVFVIALVHDRRILRAGLLVAGLVLVVSPWTLRNYSVLETFVPISTNGGDNFYRANNPLADGGYTVRGEIALPREDELVMDYMGKKLGMQWIKHHSMDFAQLALEKQLRFMGDDSSGVFFSLKRGEGTQSAALYAIAKLASNLWWLAAWALIALICVRRRIAQTPVNFLVWLWLYLFVLHSVFESNGKYHIPMLWVLCILLAHGIYGKDPRGNTRSSA